ncbi:MAG TPA: 6-bladed beta-propeller [Longimicrobium sp.]|nr:6-bladed beta-propeller [Longimicrobium sp.]
MIQRIVITGFLLLLAVQAPLGAQPVVRMPGTDQMIRREARTLFSVGAADGAQAFGAVGDVAFDAAENLYVLDRLNPRVVVFDSAGRFVRAFGRRGGGPGEFGAPQQMTVTRAGEIVVSDVGRRALAVFNRDGSFARNVPYAGASMLIGRRLAAHPRGGFVSLAMGNPTARNANAFGEEVLLWLPAAPASPRALLTVSTPRSRASVAGGIACTRHRSSRPAFTSACWGTARWRSRTAPAGPSASSTPPAAWSGGWSGPCSRGG